MAGYWYFVSLFLALCMEVVWGACTYPGDIIADAELIEETRKTSYSTGDLVLFECEKKGASHVAMFCQGDNTWTEPDRRCSDSHIWNRGAMFGVLVCVCNYFVAGGAILYSRVKYGPVKKKKQEAEDESAAK